MGTKPPKSAARLLFSTAMAGLFLLSPLAAHAQTSSGGCQYVLGFKVLHDMDSADVGDCMDNQFLAATSGDQTLMISLPSSASCGSSIKRRTSFIRPEAARGSSTASSG